MINIRIGDLVRFLTEKLEGKVTGIIDHSTVNVFVDEYGFEIPASVNDLVVIHSDFAQPDNSGNKHQPQTQKSVLTQATGTLYLAIVPDNFNNLPESRYELFLVNDTAQNCLYSITFREEDKYKGIIAGNCNPDNIISIGLYSLKDIDNTIKAVRIQANFFQKGITNPKNAIETEIKINPVNLCKSGAYKHARWFSSVSLLRPLDKEYQIEEIDEKQLQEAVKEKKKAETTAVARSQKQTTGNIIEIDLHCNELLSTTTGMDNKDILEYQLDVFRKTMEEYKLRKGLKIVFIHGKGDGILRQRILWELQTKYKRHQHQDASFKQYGYGATLVTIK